MKTIKPISFIYCALLILLIPDSANAVNDEGSYYDYPLQQYYYAINSSSFGRASFYEASGISSINEVDPNDFRNQMKTHKKSNAFYKVTLSRGVFFDSQLFSSYISGNSVTPENLTIQLMDSSGNVSAAWELGNAYMVSYNISAGTQNDGITVNSVTLAYSWMQRNF